MKIKYSYDGRQFLVYNSPLAKYIKKMIPRYSYQKRIPREILKLHPKYLGSLFKFMMLGDGCFRKRGEGTYITTSRGLADDFVELVAKLGKYATVIVVDLRGRGGMINGRKIKSKRLAYVISMGNNHKEPRFNHHRKDQVSIVNDYNGYVACLSLDKNHTMFVKRNGKVCWCGNSAGAWQLYMLVQDFDENKTYSKDDLKSDREKWRFK